MDDDQQFCLRWNNHQSTLVAVFDTLLENGTLVDCTLAAEGKCLNAHKVVLSACSPYFEALLSKHFDKHPILILKDVKFQELKAMMDYMYRGEVNISQDQLGALLKAAESLQIKGLSDNRKGETERKPAPAPPPPKSPQPASTLPKVQGLTIEQRTRDDSREGSMSPGPRKKKRLRRKSEELDNHDASNSSESHSLPPAQNIPTLPAVTKMNADVPEQVETKSEILTRHKQTDEMPQVPIIKEKIETHTELMLEPKSEYVEEMNEDSIEDLTLDDDDLSNMDQMDDGAGPSHGNTGEGSSQGFGGWHMGNQSQDEVFLAAQEAVGAHRDSQDILQVTKVVYLPPSPTRQDKFTQTDLEIAVMYRCKDCHMFVKTGKTHCNKCIQNQMPGAKPESRIKIIKKIEKSIEAKVLQKNKLIKIVLSDKNKVKKRKENAKKEGAKKPQEDAKKPQEDAKKPQEEAKKPKIIQKKRPAQEISQEIKTDYTPLKRVSRSNSDPRSFSSKRFNYGRSCEACILLKESGQSACPSCQKRVENQPNNKAYNYGKNCEACILLKEKGRQACPGCQKRLVASLYNFGKNCEACILLKEDGKYACTRCQKGKNKKKAKKPDSTKETKNKNVNTESEETRNNNVNSTALAETGEPSRSADVVDDDDIFDEYVSLRDLINLEK